MTGERAGIEINDIAHLDVPFEWSDDLMASLMELTPGQRRAIPQVLLSEMTGKSLSKIFGKGPDYIATHHTWYHTWRIDERFQKALEQARKEYTQGIMDNSLNLAVVELRRITPGAVRVLENFIREANKVFEAVDMKKEILGIMETGNEAQKLRAIKALDSLLKPGLQAAVSALDRAGVETASKAMAPESKILSGILNRLIEAGKEEKEVE